MLSFIFIMSKMSILNKLKKTEFQNKTEKFHSWAVSNTNASEHFVKKYKKGVYHKIIANK